jgi:hypothetical protein
MNTLVENTCNNITESNVLNLGPVIRSQGSQSVARNGTIRDSDHVLRHASTLSLLPRRKYNTYVLGLKDSPIYVW